MKRSAAIGILFFLVALLFSACKQTTASGYAVLIGLDSEDSPKLAEYDTVVIDAQYYTKDEIAAVQANGTVVYSYLNIGSIETFREGCDSVRDCALAPYDNWPGEYWADVSRPEWRAFVADEASSLVSKGVDGFFLDNADVYYLYPSDAFYQGLVSMIGSLGQYEKPILVNGGDVFVSKAVLDATEPLSCITGVNQECVFTNINFSDGTLIRQNTETKRYYQDYLARCKRAGLDVFLTEYAAASDPIARSIEEFCAKNDYRSYISGSVDLNG